jgi:putative lipoprotein
MRWHPLFLAFSFAVMFQACSTTTPPAAQTPAKLGGTAWLAEDIDGKGVVDRAQSTVEFVDDQRAAGSLACNRYTTTYSADATGLRFGTIGATRRMCPPALMDQEARFSAALEGTRGLRFEPTGALLLLDGDGRVQARLMPMAPPK